MNYAPTIVIFKVFTTSVGKIVRYLLKPSVFKRKATLIVYHMNSVLSRAMLLNSR